MSCVQLREFYLGSPKSLWKGSLAHMLGTTDVMEQLIGFMLFDRPHINQIGPLGEQQFHLTFWIGYLRAPQHTIFFFATWHRSGWFILPKIRFESAFFNIVVMLIQGLLFLDIEYPPSFCWGCQLLSHQWLISSGGHEIYIIQIQSAVNWEFHLPGTNIAIAGKIHHEWIDVSPIQNGGFPLLC